MNNKPTLTKKQVEAFKQFTKLDLPKQDRVARYIERCELWESDFVPLREMGFDKFVLALYNGYEVEKTFEDELLDLLQTDLESYASYDVIVDTWNAIKELMDKWQNRRDGASTNEENQDLIKPKL